MPDKALENAKLLKSKANSEVSRLEAEIHKWRAELARADQFIDQWNAFAAGEPVNPVDDVSDDENKTAPSQKPIRKTTGNSRKEDVVGAAREIILERAAPIMRDELYGLLTERGLVIQGKDPQMVLSTMLWRMRDHIARVEGGGYWPADIANAEVGYDPTTANSFDSTLNKPASEVLDPDSEEYKDASQNAG